ncbi:MAG TPA: restriction endonuclease [Pyrinomonadaceae bacterium]
MAKKIVLANVDRLTWQEFERLVTFYLKEKIGSGLSIFGGSKDQGRDASFQGVANEYPSNTRPWGGNWIFQCKHRTSRTKTSGELEKALITALNGELEKIFKKHSLRCDNYIYITNLNVSNSFRSDAVEVLKNFFVKNFPKTQLPNLGVIEYKDLEPYIAKNSFIRRAFPQLLNFQDLESALLKKEDSKNRGYLKAARTSIKTFVSTHHYISAVELVHDSHFVMLVGDPKSGKTTIVEALALAFLQDGEFKPHFIRNTDEFFAVESLLPPEEKALFICDDIFGQHELDAEKLADWTDYFKSVAGLLHGNRRFVFTTRKYIYNEFARKSGLRAFFSDEKDPSRYLVKLIELSRHEREQILEKHLEESDLPQHIVKLALASKEEILNSTDFSPEVIRSLVSLLGSKDANEVSTTITTHINHPNKYLFDLFDEIAPDKQLLLLSVAIAQNKVITNVESRYLGLLQDVSNGPSVRFETFINDLDGSIIRKRHYSDSSEVEYYHPSMFDVIVGICSRDQHYRHLMLRHVNLELLWLLTIRPNSPKPNAINLLQDDFPELNQGLETLILREASLQEVTTLLHWIDRSLTIDVSYNFSFQHLVNQVKRRVGSSIGKNEFYLAHENATLEQWINLFDKFHLLREEVSYKFTLADRYRASSVAKYWRLLFVLEAVSAGFIDEHLPKADLDLFVEKLTTLVGQLNRALNINNEGRPKTSEGWLARFYLVQDLISKMKKSGTGKKIIDEKLLADWNIVMRLSDFAKNRHSGMVKSGYWSTTPSRRGIISSEMWDSLLT